MQFYTIDIDLQKQLNQMENIHNYCYKQKFLKKRFGYNYFLDKFNYLVDFFTDKDNKSYLLWIIKYHKLDGFKKPIFNDYYKNCKNVNDVLELTNKYKKIYNSIKKDGCYIIKMKEKYKFCILGINDGGNRLAILHSLKIKSYKCVVNKNTYDIVKKFKLLYNK